MDLADLGSADDARLVVNVEVRACFSQRSSMLEVGWSPSGAWTVRDADRRTVDVSEAKALAARIVAAMLREEVAPVGRSTTVYDTRVSWTAGRASGQATYQATEISRSTVVAETLRDRPDLLPLVSPYSRATGLFEIVEDFTTAQSGGSAP